MPPSSLQAQIDRVDLAFLYEDFPRLLNSMTIGTQRIRDIVMSLRTFSHLDEAELKAVDLHEGLESTLLLLQHRLKATGKRPEITLLKSYGDLPSVYCYASKLNQVFMNLLVNAIDALEETFDRPDLPRDPKLQIRTEAQADRVILQITDNGIGMNDEVKAKLFDPFFTTKSVGRGTGLGLAISYQVIVEQHHGKLMCHSAPGVGSTFTIELPLHQPDQSTPPLPSGLYPPSSVEHEFDEPRCPETSSPCETQSETQKTVNRKTGFNRPPA